MNDAHQASEEKIDELGSINRKPRLEIGAREGEVHSPNQFPLKKRVENAVLSLILFSYCTYGVLHGGIYMPAKRSNGSFVHGLPMWLIYGAMLSAVANMLLVVRDHYDKRDNEVEYQEWALFTKILGWMLFALALLLQFLVFQ